MRVNLKNALHQEGVLMLADSCSTKRSNSERVNVPLIVHMSANPISSAESACLPFGGQCTDSIDD